MTIYDINDIILKKAKAKFEILRENYKRELHATSEQLEATFQNLHYDYKLAGAVKDADLLIEAIPETPDIKIDFYQKLAAVAPQKTDFATNSSTLLPGQFAEATGRPSKSVALHFANDIWKYNMAEIMGHAGTSKETFDDVEAFAKAIGMAAMDLYARDVADPQTIDKTWMLATGAPMGPFAIYDIIELATAFNINKMTAEKTNNPDKLKDAEMIKEKFIDQNKMGVSTGEGFYKYLDPHYLDKDFLKNS